MADAWRVVDPVLGDVLPLHPEVQPGPREAGRLPPARDSWPGAAG